MSSVKRELRLVRLLTWSNLAGAGERLIERT